MRLGTYTDTLELENEMLRDKVKKLQEQLTPYLEAEKNMMNIINESQKLDQGINNMMNFYRQKTL
jgi:regulator of replication initiation timing